MAFNIGALGAALKGANQSFMQRKDQQRAEAIQDDEIEQQRQRQALEMALTKKRIDDYDQDRVKVQAKEREGQAWKLLENLPENSVVDEETQNRLFANTSAAPMLKPGLEGQMVASTPISSKASLAMLNAQRARDVAGINADSRESVAEKNIGSREKIAGMNANIARFKAEAQQAYQAGQLDVAQQRVEAMQAQMDELASFRAAQVTHMNNQDQAAFGRNQVAGFGMPNITINPPQQVATPPNPGRASREALQKAVRELPKLLQQGSPQSIIEALDDPENDLIDNLTTRYPGIDVNQYRRHLERLIAQQSRQLAPIAPIASHK